MTQRVSRAVSGMIFASLLGTALSSAAERAIVTIDKNLDLKAVEQRDAALGLEPSAGGSLLALKLGHKEAWPGITFVAPGSGWDLSAFGCVTVELKNTGTTPVHLGLRLDSPSAGKAAATIQATHEFAAGEAAPIKVTLRRKLPVDLAGKLFGMRGYPGGYSEKEGLDVGHVTRLTIFAARPSASSQVELRAMRAVGRPPLALPDDPQQWFPMIDALGQYRHGDWPGKTHGADEFARHRAAETAELAQHAGPADWNAYGGWAGGPKLDATGFFHTAKHAGKWWLVDPEGRLFWSHGIDCVRAEAATPITDRRQWFADLPQPGTPLAQFFGKGDWAPHGYYQGKRYETFNFYGANLSRKYGPEWYKEFDQLAHRRLRSWGMNTIGNWSDSEVYRVRKTPYVATIGAHALPLEGSNGYWGKFADVFAPAFRENLRQHMAREKDQSAGDPWCLGYFVDNELSWGEELSLAMATLASPAEQPAKQAFVEDLKAKYRTIEALNHAWGTAHASWEALLAGREPPDKKKARDDLAAFATRTAETYFRTCAEAVHEVAPHNLYLGCRFAWTNDRAVRAAAKFCDVVSFNRYQESVAEFRLPEGVDMPVVIGEFHFGALDRGMFHTGLRPVESQAERGKAYQRYVGGALANAWIVGTHWFQYADQATTGRGDGENYQIGFVDDCDTPYPETIQACREVGQTMYPTRLGK